MAGQGYQSPTTTQASPTVEALGPVADATGQDTLGNEALQQQMQLIQRLQDALVDRYQKLMNHPQY